jgi:hypothetical protein
MNRHGAQRLHCLQGAGGQTAFGYFTHKKMGLPKKDHK